MGKVRERCADFSKLRLSERLALEKQARALVERLPVACKCIERSPEYAVDDPEHCLIDRLGGKGRGYLPGCIVTAAAASSNAMPRKESIATTTLLAGK